MSNTTRRGAWIGDPGTLRVSGAEAVRLEAFEETFDFFWQQKIFEDMSGRALHTCQ
jgi:hypothetical protein